MLLRDVAKVVEGDILAGENNGDLVIDRAYAVDLLSDILALTDERTTPASLSGYAMLSKTLRCGQTA